MKLLFVTTKKSAKERFAIKPTASGKNINFWHDDGQRIFLYTFVESDMYSRQVVWSDKICRELLEDLRKPTPSVKVIRFAIDNLLVFSDVDTQEVPAMPQKTEAQQMYQEKWDRTAFRAEVEERKCEEPAPYILYGTFSKRSKEYSWRLTPDKPCRQGIQPGHRVLVWTRYGFCRITVTRIEEAGDQPQPECRVKRKLTLKELAEERKSPPPDEG